jgi:hypothetical protein
MHEQICAFFLYLLHGRMFVFFVFIFCGLVETPLWYRGFLYLFTPLIALSIATGNDDVA